MSRATYGFWIAGPVDRERVLVAASKAFAGFAACDSRLELDREHYLSAFCFGHEFSEHMAETGSPKGYDGPCGADHIWWDIDRPGDLEAALRDARALCLHLTDGLAVGSDDLLVFFSGYKGVHVGVPTALWAPAASAMFHNVARRFAEQVAAGVPGGVVVDPAAYIKVQPFRAPNSRHAKTGLYKRRLTVEELLGLSLERVLALAAGPAPFEIPAPSSANKALAALWEEAEREVAATAEATTALRAAAAAAGGRDRLNRQTMEFMREGAPEGERHQRVFSAAANLAEFGCPPKLAHALLTDAGLDSGLSPSEVARQINCGLAHAAQEGARG